MAKKKKVLLSNTALFFILLGIIIISVVTLAAYSFISDPAPSPASVDNPQTYGKVSLRIIKPAEVQSSTEPGADTS